MEGFEILVTREFAEWMKSEGYQQEFLLSPKGEKQLMNKFQLNFDSLLAIVKPLGFKFRMELKLDGKCSWKLYYKDAPVRVGEANSCSEVQESLIDAIEGLSPGARKAIEFWKSKG